MTPGCCFDLRGHAPVKNKKGLLLSVLQSLAIFGI